MTKTSLAPAILVLVSLSTAAQATSPLPKPGCYQSDFSARVVTTSNGQMLHTTTSSVDGSTGTQTITTQMPNGQGWTKKFLGAGPFRRIFDINGRVVTPYCPTFASGNGQGQFDYKIACKTYVVNPANLKITKIFGPVERWQMIANVSITSQVGLNNMPQAMSDTTGNLKAMAKALPANSAERANLNKQIEQLEKLQKQNEDSNSELSKARRDIEQMSRNGSSEEQAIARMALEGAIAEQSVHLTEILTWTGSQCN